MNAETYEALKRILGFVDICKDQNELTKEQETDLEQVENWIEEVAKEYDNPEKVFIERAEERMKARS